MVNQEPRSFLLEIPLEIRLQIFEYLLPDWHTVQYKADASSPRGHISNHWSDGHRIAWDEPAIRSLLTINHQIHNEACLTVQKLDRLPYEILIDRDAFYCDNPEYMLETAERHVTWTWESVFSDAQHSKMKELRITIIPTNFWGYWDCLAPALRSLCDNLLSSRELPRKVRIECGDMARFNDWDIMTGDYGGPDDVAIPAFFRDYAKALRSLEALIAQVGTIEVHLPYWMEFANGMEELVGHLRKSSEVHLVFRPLETYPPGYYKIEDGVPVRLRLCLADLGEEENRRATLGMIKRFRTAKC